MTSNIAVSINQTSKVRDSIYGKHAVSYTHLGIIIDVTPQYII